MSSEGKVILGCLGMVPEIRNGLLKFHFLFKKSYYVKCLLFVAPPVASRDLDYENAEKELNELRRAISAAGEQGATLFIKCN
jgi:hypothetical protein